MIARVLVILLLLTGFALPATASAHCRDAATATQAMVGSHHGDHMPAPVQAVTEHACIGCVPPSDWLAARILAPLPRAAMKPDARVATLGPLAPTAPDPRPPRRG